MNERRRLRRQHERERVFVSIGSNIDAEDNVRAAVDAMRRHFGTLVLSPVYETEAQGFDGPPFINLVAAFDTELSLPEVIDILHGIERERGRIRDGKHSGSRELDLDVILYGDHDFHDQGLDVPRHEIRDYAFVLKPLCDLCPDGVHPRTGERYRELWRSFSAAGQSLRRIDDFVLDADRD